MDSTTYVSASHMSGLADTLDIIAANLANADTAGYKRKVGRFQDALLQATGPVPSPSPQKSVRPAFPQFDTRPVDFSQGPIRTTGRPLDLAIRGDGFFVLDTAAGERYTRKGRLYVSPQGELTDGAGNRFVADGGALRIPDGVHDISVGPDGQVTAGGDEVGRLRLADVPRTDMLTAEGNAHFRNDGPAAREASDSEVIQGAIEESNVSPVVEMVALVQVMRAYEASTHVMKRMDSLERQFVKQASA